jgi:transcriptional regulator with XRE-family HTH domain
MSTLSLEAKARTLGLSADELMELAFDVLEDAADEQAIELRALIDQVNRQIPETLDIVDRRLRGVEELLNGGKEGAARRAGSPTPAPEGRRSAARNQVDIHVGGRVRLRRQALGLSEGQLACIIGVTTRKARQFERGESRIGASRLLELSRVLDVPVAYFFDDLAPPPTDLKQLELAHNFARITNEADQESVIEHAHSLAAE